MNNKASIKIVNFVTHGAGLFVQECGHIVKIFSSSTGHRSDKLSILLKETRKALFFSYPVAWGHVLSHCHTGHVVKIYHF